MSNKFTVHTGKFWCKTCNKEVGTIRIYTETGMGSWMCSDKHLSEVQVYQIGYKKKKDYEREE
jgi:hypothetical protein